jgi:hypothetical protein
MSLNACPEAMSGTSICQMKVLQCGVELPGLKRTDSSFSADTSVIISYN